MTFPRLHRRDCLKLGAAVALSCRQQQAQAAPIKTFVLSDVDVPLPSSLHTTPAAEAIVDRATAELGETPHPIPVVHTQGLLPHEGIRDESVLARRDWRRSLTQGMAWRLSADPRFAGKAQAIVAAWLQVYRPSFNPVDEAEFVDFLFCLDFIRSRLTEAQTNSIAKLARDLADGYLDPTPRIIARANDFTTGLNNWHSHRIKLGTAGAYLSGDPALIAAAQACFVAHVGRNIDQDGLTYDFKQRDALHYVVYDIEPMMVTAAIAKAHGNDWYRAPQIIGRLPAALDCLQPYALGERNHMEFVNSTVDFDRKRAKAKVPGYEGPWQRQEASNLYWIAAKIDVKYRSVSDQLEADPLVQCLYVPE